MLGYFDVFYMAILLYSDVLLFGWFFMLSLLLVLVVNFFCFFTHYWCLFLLI